MRRKRLSKKLQSAWKLKTPLYLKPADKRYKIYKKQLKTNGFSDTETWNFDYVIASFILPRLKRFREINNGFPEKLGEKGWNVVLDKMIRGFELHILDKINMTDLEYENIEEAWKLLAEYHRDLWW